MGEVYMKQLALIICCAVFLGSNCVCHTGLKISRSETSAKRYCGGSNCEATTEALSYAHKETVAQFSMKGDVPNYNGSVEASNCANVAGAELIGYYDRFYENLIPNYKTYIQMGSMLVYRSASAEINAVMQTLHSYMGTSVGTTFNGFHNGMRTYVEEHSYSYMTEDLGNLNFEKYKSAVETNKPVALFLNDYAFYLGAEQASDGEIIKSEHYNVAHVVIACGYKIDTYYDTDGHIICTRTYLKVASGFASYGLIYLCLDGKSTIDRATSIIIN